MTTNETNDQAKTEATLPEGWITFITPFAETINKTVNETTDLLKKITGEAGDQAIELLQDENMLTFDDIKNVCEGVPVGVLRKAVANVRKAPIVQEIIPVNTVTQSNVDILPQVPDDESWLVMLKTGGELKVGETTVISAIRAALAHQCSLYDVPNTLIDRMETHAEELQEPVGAEFYKLRKLIAQQSYGDLFAALDVDGHFVNKTRKGKLQAKLAQELWPALFSFQEAIKGWTEAWQQGASNPAMMVNAIATMAGGMGAGMPPGMMQPPSTDGLRDEAETVIDNINRIFAGTAIPVAMALAYEAQRIKEVLENPGLPAQIGAVNREQMLRVLDIDVSADYVRLERNITRFALAILNFPKVTSGNEEYSYILALFMLGTSIPWEKFGSEAGGRVRRNKISRVKND